MLGRKHRAAFLVAERVLSEESAPTRAQPRPVQGKGEELAAVLFGVPGFASGDGLDQLATRGVQVVGAFGRLAAVKLRRRDAEPIC